MSHWPLTRYDVTRPAYRSIARGIAAAIDSGSLRPGDRLPPHRDLAWQLDVSVHTVSRAYEELIRADLITGEVGRGSFVKSGPREVIRVPWHRASPERPLIDLSMMTPVSLPQIADAWRDSMIRVANNLPDPVMLSFRPQQTMDAYSNMAAGWLARCGLVTPAQRILITNGTTTAMMVALMTVAGPGDVIATESSTSHTLKPTAHHMHLRLKGISGDERGMLPEALTAAARASDGRMKAVFLLPSGGGPFARVIDSDRRKKLAEAAAESDLLILENDTLGPVSKRRPPPIASFAPERSFYFTGLSKCLAPGLRVGFLVAPGHFAEHIRNRHLSLSWMATPLMVELARDWIESGMADNLLKLQAVELANRNRITKQLLGGRSQGFSYGLHRWLPLPGNYDERGLISFMLNHDIAVTPGAGFAVIDDKPALRLCLGAANIRDLEHALNILTQYYPVS